MKHAKYRSLVWGVLLLASVAGSARAAAPNFEVRVVDEATSRGVPLVELETTNAVRYVTDSAGRAAILEPGLEGLTTWFKVTSHDYEFSKDGFGFQGFRAEVRAGGKKEIKIVFGQSGADAALRLQPGDVPPGLGGRAAQGGGIVSCFQRRPGLEREGC